MTIEVQSKIFKIIHSKILDVFFMQYPAYKKMQEEQQLTDYQLYGYNISREYKYDPNKPNLKSALLKALGGRMQNDDSVKAFLSELRKGDFSGKNLRDKINESSKTSKIKLDVKYLEVYLNYFVEGLDFKSNTFEIYDKFVAGLLAKNEIEISDIEILKTNNTKKTNTNNIDDNVISQYYCYYTKDGEEMRKFRFEVNMTTNSVIIDHTHSNRYYVGKMNSIDSHRSIYVEASKNGAIHIILYVGKVFEGDVLFGIVTLIDNLGKAVSTRIVLELFSGKYSDDKTIPESILMYLNRPGILKIQDKLETKRTLEELRRSLTPNDTFSNLEGYHLSFIISKKRRLVITFGIYINKYGIVETWRKTQNGDILKSKGVVINKSKTVSTLNIFDDNIYDLSNLQYRILLNTSNNKKNIFGFITGVYCGFSVDYSNPRGGRICLIKQNIKKQNNHEEIMASLIRTEIEIGKADYLKLLKKYPNFEKFFAGNLDDDHLIESSETFDIK